MITFNASHGTFGCSSRKSFKLACAKLRSDVIHWYAMFQPIAPYFLRSWMTALKKQRPKSKFLYAAGCLHPSNRSMSKSMYERPKFAFKPFGGS